MVWLGRCRFLGPSNYQILSGPPRNLLNRLPFKEKKCSQCTLEDHVFGGFETVRHQIELKLGSSTHIHRGIPTVPLCAHYPPPFLF
eukprot:m.369389 g.369389  ORF g.369389 m.369389 type:complete len:86 (+) comp16675_c0_seq23:1364-1621(+)